MFYEDTATKVIRGHKIKSYMGTQNQKLYEDTATKVIRENKIKSYMKTQQQKL